MIHGSPMIFPLNVISMSSIIFNPHNSSLKHPKLLKYYGTFLAAWNYTFILEYKGSQPFLLIIQLLFSFSALFGSHCITFLQNFLRIHTTASLNLLLQHINNKFLPLSTEPSLVVTRAVLWKSGIQ